MKNLKLFQLGMPTSTVTFLSWICLHSLKDKCIRPFFFNASNLEKQLYIWIGSLVWTARSYLCHDFAVLNLSSLPFSPSSNILIGDLTWDNWDRNTCHTFFSFACSFLCSFKAHHLKLTPLWQHETYCICQPYWSSIADNISVGRGN